MPHLFILSLIILLCSIDGVQHDLNGYYKAGGSYFDRAQWYVKGKRNFIAGIRLDLRADSTFHFTSCGCESTGNWIRKADAVILSHTHVDQSTDPSEVRCYLPEQYILYGSALIGENEGEFIEILRKVDRPKKY